MVFVVGLKYQSRAEDSVIDRILKRFLSTLEDAKPDSVRAVVIITR